MARSAYNNYLAQTTRQEEELPYASFESQPDDLRASMLAQVESIHDKLAVRVIPSLLASVELAISRWPLGRSGRKPLAARAVGAKAIGTHLRSIRTAPLLHEGWADSARIALRTGQGLR